MTVKFDLERCTGCPGAREAPCVRLCPGDLLRRDGGGLRLGDAAACWDCGACVKACRHGALSLVLPPELGGRGSSLSASAAGAVTRWLLIHPDGRPEPFETPFRTQRR